VVIAASAYFSCLSVPVPTFALMLAGGGFADAGDLVLWQVLAVAYIAALCGDQTGFQLGRLGGRWLDKYLVTRPSRAALFARAQLIVDRWGSVGVFFSTWAAAPLGPWVNFAAGAARLNPWRFLIWDALGEAIWVTGYVTLGYYFAANLDALTTLVSDWAWLLTAFSLVIAASFFLFRQSKQG
jgi:membrane protein DedA with SNARE-associated domain